MSPQRQHWQRTPASPDSGGGDDDEKRGLPPKKDTKRKEKVVLVRQLERLGNGTSAAISASHTITEMS